MTIIYHPDVPIPQYVIAVCNELINSSIINHFKEKGCETEECYIPTNSDNTVFAYNPKTRLYYKAEII